MTEINMIHDIDSLSKLLCLYDYEKRNIDEVGKRYPWRLTKYYASLIDPDDPDCPIRRQALPDPRELDDSLGVPDPLCEEINTPVPGVVQVYPDRVAVIATSQCPVYCRFCLRKRFPRDGSCDLAGDRLDRIVKYIRANPAIRDVLITGGDPLMLDDGILDGILGAIRTIGHVEIIRIGTRTPCTWPERITESFVSMVRSHHPVWINTQFNHPRELTSEAARAVGLIVDGGIPVGNQSVLLRGVNDDCDTMRALVQGLVAMRVRPYYLYQAQVLAGTGHFITSIERGIDIIAGLRGWTTGFSVPQYVLDTPYGKIPLNPSYMKGRKGDFIEFVSYSGKLWSEYNPQELPSQSSTRRVLGGARS